MTESDTRDAATVWKGELETMFSGSSWFKEVKTSSDSGGVHLMFYVTDMKEMIADIGHIPSDPKSVKLCFISVGRPPVPPVSASVPPMSASAQVAKV